MSASPWWLDRHDLLRQRRLERGLPADAPALPAALRLVLQGGSLGLALLLLVLVPWLLLLWWGQQRALGLAQLSAVPASLQSLEGRLRLERSQLKRVDDRNAALARGLVSATSGSELLTQLAAITPAGVQLSALSVSGETLNLKGLAVDPGAFARVNALGILLGESPLIQASAVKVVKLSREAPAAAGAGSAATPPTLAPVRWELSATMARLKPAEQLAVLQRLGADGLARRLQTLVALGLLP
ncbi:MAG: PilN domain-containing protein [Vulcanococcus sp.]